MGETAATATGAVCAFAFRQWLSFSKTEGGDDAPATSAIGAREAATRRGSIAIPAKHWWHEKGKQIIFGAAVGDE